MLVLRDYIQGDIQRCSHEEYVNEDEEYHYETHCYMRTIIDSVSNNIIAIAMVQKCGEVGLLIDNSLLSRSTIRKFYTLLVVFAAEAFAFIDTNRLFTGMKSNGRDLRWIKFLDFKVSDLQDPDHTRLGWITYELPLSRWVQ